MNKLSIVICKDAQEAIEQGYDYRAWNPQPVRVVIDKAVVVTKGTIEGNSSVDFILSDESGRQYVAIITGNLLKTLGGVLE